MGNSYEFMVHKSLTISNIIFDALDSSLDPTLGCLQMKSNCCTISGTALSPNPNNPSPVQTCEVQSYQNEYCATTFGYSMFQFMYLESYANGEIGETLSIENSSFLNFFHDFTSLIGFTKGHGHVTIQNTIFQQFSNCGSIFRDKRELGNNFEEIFEFLSVTDVRGGLVSKQQISSKYYLTPIESCDDST
jgi:hypothetical protein